MKHTLFTNLGNPNSTMHMLPKNQGYGDYSGNFESYDAQRPMNVFKDLQNKMTIKDGDTGLTMEFDKYMPQSSLIPTNVTIEANNIDSTGDEYKPLKMSVKKQIEEQKENIKRRHDIYRSLDKTVLDSTKAFMKFTNDHDCAYR
jgi:hypothetical protein